MKKKKVVEKKYIVLQGFTCEKSLIKPYTFRKYTAMPGAILNKKVLDFLGVGSDVYLERLCSSVLEEYEPNKKYDFETFEVTIEALIEWHNKFYIEEQTEEEKVPDQKAKTNYEIFYRIGQAKEFIKRQPIYFSQEGFFWVWNSGRFCYERKDEIDMLNSIREALGVDTINSNARNEILIALKQVARANEPKAKPKGWLQFHNVLIDPKTLQKTTASAEYFLTNPLPHQLGETDETPKIDKLLSDWVVREGIQDASYVISLLECVAYAITDDLFMQRIFAFTGAGSNGKGTFLELVKNLIGKDNCVSVDLKKLATNNFAISSIYKKLVAFSGEVSYNDLTNTNVLKKLTGEDLIEFEFKGKNSFSDNSVTTIFIATNSLPVTPDKCTGFYRRWQIIDFPNQFEIKPNILKDIPEIEYCNLCLKCVKILNKLYENPMFTNEGKFEDREIKYEQRSNPLPTFIEEICEYDPAENIKLQEFANVYNEWLKAKRLRTITTRQVGAILRNNGYEIGKRKDQENSYTAILSLKYKTAKTTEKTAKTTETTKTTEVPISDIKQASDLKVGSSGSSGSSGKEEPPENIQTTIQDIYRTIDGSCNVGAPRERLSWAGKELIDKMLADGRLAEHVSGFIAMGPNADFKKYK